MSYKDFFDKNKRDVTKRALATKIIDMIDKIELNSTELSARRWIWELIQNARDISNNTIDISVDISEDSVKFSHNGKPFSTKHLLSLINQVSAKDRSNTEVVGKYGTGFITTSLLSKIVEVESLLKEDNEPLKRFKITLDRTSKDLSGLSESLEHTMKQLDLIDDSPEVEHRDGDISTVFTYLLNTDEAKKVANIGQDDLIKAIDYVLILQPKINKVTVNGKDIYTQELEDDLFKSINGTIYKVFKNESYNTYLKVTKSNTSIVVPLEIQDGVYIFKNLENDMPRLFCEFPCIGTENFSFPVVLNNSNFFVTEPRDGVHLTNSQHRDVLNNKSIINEGVDMLLSLIEHSASLGNKVEGIEKLFYLPDFQNYNWQNNMYIEESIIQRLRDEGGCIKFINLKGTLYSLNDICVPDFDNPEMTELAFELMDSCVKEEVIPSNQCYKYIPLKNCNFNIFKDTNHIVEILTKCNDTSQLGNKLFKRNDTLILNPIEFINKFLKLASKDLSIWSKVITLPIFPTLKGDFKLISETWDLSESEEMARDILVKASSTTNLTDYTASRYPVATSFLNIDLDTSLLNTKKYTTVETLNCLKRCVLTLKSALILIGATPTKDNDLYERHKKLKQMASIFGNISSTKEIRDYSIQYIEACESVIISEILKNKNNNIEHKNLALEYIYKYDLQKILKENLHDLVLHNIKGTITPLNKIPAKNCYYSVATKPELEELYFKFFPEEQGRFINTKYKFIEDLFQPTIISNYSMCNAISKRVISMLHSTAKFSQDEALLQMTYNYIQKNLKDLDIEFPLLKDKVFLLCSKETLIENQNIVEKIRNSANNLNMSVENYLEHIQSKSNPIDDLFMNTTNCFDDLYYFDDSVRITTGSKEEICRYNKAREIGAKGEKMAYEAIINYYKNAGYELTSYSNDGTVANLYGQDIRGVDESISIKLFADNQQGYDIIISIDDEVKYYVEVKSTVHNVKNVDLSQRQLAKASICYWSDKEYILICITNIESNPKFNVVRNPFAQLYTNAMNARASIELADNIKDYKKDIHVSLNY